MYGCEMVCLQPILERAVRVRTRQIGLVDEQLARNRVHRRQHELVGDPALAQLALDHPVTARGRITHESASAAREASVSRPKCRRARCRPGR